MNAANRILAPLAILFCLVPAAAQWDEQLRRSRESLKGLPFVAVAANLSSMDALPDDPSERELLTMLETRLKNVGRINSGNGFTQASADQARPSDRVATRRRRQTGAKCTK